MPATSPPRNFSLKIEPQNHLLERTRLVEDLFALFQSGKRWIVIHGESGLGKKTLANAFFHEADRRGGYEQFGWIPFFNNLPKSIVKAVATGDVSGMYDKNEQFYRMLAEDEIRTLRNYDTSQLIVIDGVHSEQDILADLDLLEIKKAHILITSTQKFSDPRFLNFQIPPLEDGDVLHFFKNAGLRKNLLSPEEMQAMQGNPWLFRLLTRHIPKSSEGDARIFIDRIFTGLQNAAADENQIVALAGQLFDNDPLDAAAYWVLMQMAALPPGHYDTETVAAYLQPEAEEPEEDPEVTSFKGFERFAQAWTHATLENATLLSRVLGNLENKGWLGSHEGDYAIHENTIQLLQYKKLNRPEYFPELYNCLSINYFTAEHGRLKDNLFYENHLLNFLDFLGESTSDIYLGALWKLIKFYEDIVDYRLEVQCREKHLALAKAVRNQEKIADLMADLAENYQRLGILELAFKYAEEALKIAQTVVSDIDPLIASCKSCLGRVYSDLGEYEKARDLLETALESDLINFGDNHPRVAMRQSNLAVVYKELGEYEKARDLLEAALKSDLINFGDTHPNVAVRQSNLANVYEALGEFEKARDLLEAALKSDLINFGDTHPSVAVCQSNLALVYLGLNQYEKARDLLKVALESDVNNFGSQHPNVAVSQSNLANVYSRLGEYEKARELLEAALESALLNFGNQHPTVALRQLNLGTVYLALNEKAKARILFMKAYDLFKILLGEGHPHTHMAKYRLFNSG